MKKIIFLFFFLLMTFTYGQKREKEIVLLIDDFARTLFVQKDSAFYYISKATKASESINDNFLLSRCYYNLGYYHRFFTNHSNAIFFLNKALPYAKRSKNYKIQAKIYEQLGLIEMDKTDYNQSLKFLLLSLDIAKKNNLNLNKCNALNGLGILYETQKDTLKALNFYKKNLKAALKNDFKDILVIAYENIALLKRKNDNQKAISYLEKAYAISKDVCNLQEQTYILINLSNVYLLSKDKDYNSKAYQCLQDAKRNVFQLSSKEALFYVHFNLGWYFTKKHEYNTALNEYFEALNKTKNIDIDQLSKLYGSISDVYLELHKYKEAYQFQIKQDSLKEIIYTIEKNKAFNEIQTKYDVEKKNLKINILTKEKEIETARKKQILYIGLVLLIPLIGLLFFYWHRIKTQKIIREKENKIHHQEVIRLEQEQELKRVRGVVEGQDQERNRVAKEIHDGVGGKLAGIKLQLAQVNSIVKNDDVSKIVNQLSNAFNELRSISHDLSLNYLTDKNLTTLLQGLQKEYKNRNEFQLDIVIFPENSLNLLPEEIKHQVYRIIQELLSNVTKHAKAKQVTINITNYHDSLNIIVEDDGCGFATNRSDGIGLKNIKERLTSINGEINIESTIERGSTIIIDIPNIK